jgi:hypothetical protein
MKFNQHERAPLNILADEWEKSGPPGHIETSMIAQRLGIFVSSRFSKKSATHFSQGLHLTKIPLFVPYRYANKKSR